MRREPWVQCNGCGKAVGSENAVVMRCPECQGEVLWSGESLRQQSHGPPPAVPTEVCFALQHSF
eukprot:4508775-Amphidinium_carterae.1